VPELRGGGGPPGGRLGAHVDPLTLRPEDDQQFEGLTADVANPCGTRVSKLGASPAVRMKSLSPSAILSLPVMT